MTVFWRYLAYRLKKSGLRTSVLVLLSVVIAHLVIMGESFAMPGAIAGSRTGLSVFYLILSAISCLIPILESAELKNRRNLDTLCAFPLGRRKLGWAHYFSGLIQLWVIYTVSYLYGFFYLFTQTAWFELSYMLPYYFLSLLLGMALYSFVLFLFNEGNTVLDGVLFCVIYLLLSFFFLGGLRIFFCDLFNLTQIDLPLFPFFYSLDRLTEHFQDLMEINVTFYNKEVILIKLKEDMVEWLIWILVGVASVIGYDRRFQKRRAEWTGDISDSAFGYKTTIPVMGYVLLAVFGCDLVLALIVWITMLTGYFVYRRSFKLKTSDILVMGLSVVPYLWSVTFG